MLTDTSHLLDNNQSKTNLLYTTDYRILQVNAGKTVNWHMPETILCSPEFWKHCFRPIEK